jgi:nickel-dependent lactate racemase
MTEQELELKFGKEIVETEDIVMHDCTDQSNMVHIGTLPSGGECLVNGLAQKADLLVAEGFIEPHFFAGYSGGRKSVLPGIASRKTVLANHCSEFIADDHARTGILDENPIHKDMVWAARQAGLSFIVNVVLDAEKHIVFATAGDTIAAHEAGCHFLDGLSRVNPIPADIVVSTNGGYPLDQNVYQAVKGMTAAEATVREGGVIIMVAKADDGIGGEAFFHQMADEPDIEKTRCLFLSRNKNETVPDQWQSQVFIRVLQKATVIFISSINDTIVRDLHMIPAHDIGEALCLAAKIIGNSTPSVTIIPDGVSIIVDKVF